MHQNITQFRSIHKSQQQRNHQIAAIANSPSIQQPIKTHTNCNNDNKKHKRHRTPRKKTTTYRLVCDTAPIQQRTMPSALPHSGTQQHHITCGTWCVYVYTKEKTEQIANNTSHYTKATKQPHHNTAHATPHNQHHNAQYATSTHTHIHSAHSATNTTQQGTNNK